MSCQAALTVGLAALSAFSAGVLAGRLFERRR